MELELEKIGKNVLIARTIKGYTQEGLGTEICMTQAWVQKVEKGEQDLSITTINKLSEGLDVDPQFLLFSTPQEVLNFNNCTQNGPFHQCTVNSEEFIEKLAKLFSSNETKYGNQ